MTVSALSQKRQELLKQLQNSSPDMLRGSLVKRYRKCGKPNCHCAKEQGHESYYLSVSMPGRRPIMIYVSLKSQNKVRKALENYQAVRKILEDISTVNREALAQKELL